MSRASSATLKESLSSNYGSMWAYLIPFSAIRQRDHIVFLSSTPSLLAFSILPILHDLMWDVSWIEEAGIMNVMVNLPWISTKMVITTLLLILGLLLLWNISRSRTRPQTRPAGIAGLASLICNSNILDHNRHIGLLWIRPDV